MPIPLKINGNEILAESITITEDNITIKPFQGMYATGTIAMSYDEFCEMRDKLIRFVEEKATQIYKWLKR